MRSPISVAWVCLVLFSAPHTAHGDWTLATAANVVHDDNVGNTRNDADKVSDFMESATLSLLQFIPFGEGYSVAAGGNASGVIYDRFSGLDHATLDGVFSLKKKWGLGAFAPWGRAGISAGRSDYQDSYRDATIYRASLEFGKRLDERWNVWAKYAFERRAAEPAEVEVSGVSSDAFSQNSRAATVNADYAASERLFINLGLLARHGDVISTTPTPGLAIFRSSKALAADPAFGPTAYAYRLIGTTYGARLGAEFALTVHNLIGCAFARLETQAQGGNNYADSLEEVTWNYRF